MHVTLIRNRDGRESISWPGILLASFLAAACAASGVAVFGFAVDWHSPAAYILAIVMSVGIVIGCGIRRGSRRPPE